jgi:hypothetical protein
MKFSNTRKVKICSDQPKYLLDSRIVDKFVLYYIPSVHPSVHLTGFFGFFFLWDWVLNSGLRNCKADALVLEPHLQSIML